MESLAKRVWLAMETIDLATMGELLAPDARWGAPEQEVPTCRSAAEILAWYDLARVNAMRADITTVVVVGESIVVGLKLVSADSTSKNRPRWQVMSVVDGRIQEIRGYETRGDATTFATSGVSTWKSS